jgi:hypothetical protein
MGGSRRRGTTVRVLTDRGRLQAAHIITTVPSCSRRGGRPGRALEPAAGGRVNLVAVTEAPQRSARAAVQDLQAAHIITAVPSCSRRGGRPGPGSRIGGGRRRGTTVRVLTDRGRL